ncbi:unnamed protein product [Pedinophyceae sp. YPF-701]|nr:unnamed protein product [Pedinophyceae sp. YPF-701]
MVRDRRVIALCAFAALLAAILAAVQLQDRGIAPSRRHGRAPLRSKTMRASRYGDYEMGFGDEEDILDFERKPPSQQRSSRLGGKQGSGSAGPRLSERLSQLAHSAQHEIGELSHGISESVKHLGESVYSMDRPTVRADAVRLKHAPRAWVAGFGLGPGEWLRDVLDYGTLPTLSRLLPGGPAKSTHVEVVVRSEAKRAAAAGQKQGEDAGRKFLDVVERRLHLVDVALGIEQDAHLQSGTTSPVMQPSVKAIVHKERERVEQAELAADDAVGVIVDSVVATLRSGGEATEADIPDRMLPVGIPADILPELDKKAGGGQGGGVGVFGKASGLLEPRGKPEAGAVGVGNPKAGSPRGEADFWGGAYGEDLEGEDAGLDLDDGGFDDEW